MSERKLATIEKVLNIKTIEGADNIECATIKGWACVVKKGDFKEGDIGIYFEVDSLLPIRPEFSFLESRGRKSLEDGSEGYRLRTIKLKGQISQGLLMPLHLFRELFLKDVTPKDNIGTKFAKEFVQIQPEVGEDVTDILGVKKYEKPIPINLRGQIKGNFPFFVRKTDQERIQNFYYDLYQTEKDTEFELTQKIDGTSATFYFKDGDFGVCSRNMNYTETAENVYWAIAKKYNIEDILKKYGHNVAIQGEVAGPGIQKNTSKLNEIQLFVFDIWDIDKQEYINPPARREFCRTYNLIHIPIIRQNFKIFSELTSIEAILKFAEGQGINGTEREGIVCKAIGKQLSFKIINNKYLLKNEE